MKCLHQRLYGILYALRYDKYLLLWTKMLTLNLQKNVFLDMVICNKNGLLTNRILSVILSGSIDT